ncbi:hypothetical protein [Dermatobacter hominis]|uniref:hypothetical protein n=1 Tax=Dermatobacter hominis TaxID=2884263 RepID=UPI001D12257F|nr:hypothetical protein [Dermatobacter hominis]UDY34859.1 hypothetical protein LH044_16135 [Dermatobacter hominis]
MQEAAGHGAEDEPGASPGPASGRTWVHPSEVGLEHRNRSDRRRAAWLTAGLVLGGVGLLVFGVAMGLGSGSDPVIADSDPRDAVAATLATLTVAGGQPPITGVVIDDDGLVAVRASALGDVQHVYVSCGGREPHQATVIDRDDEVDVAVVKADVGSGRPVVEDRSVEVGDDVLLARAGLGEGAPTMRDARITDDEVRSGTASSARLLRVETTGRATTTSMVTSTSASMITTTSGRPEPDADGAAFDGRGRFVGLVVRGDGHEAVVLPAGEVIEVALALKR